MPQSNRFLHVANGTCTTDLIHKAGIPGASSIWADALHDGPVPGGLSDEELLKVRAGYLAETSDQIEDVIGELRGWRAAVDHHDAYDELILWYEHDLFDQLNLIQVLSRIGRSRPAAATVSLICIGPLYGDSRDFCSRSERRIAVLGAHGAPARERSGVEGSPRATEPGSGAEPRFDSFPGRQRFKGLGELTPGELASLLDTRQPVTDAQYALAERAWVAFRAPDPRQLEDLLRTDSSALPFFAPALQRHLEEFPSTVDGLSRTERRVLELAESGPVDLRVAFPRMHDFETAFYIADLSFWGLVQGLAAASPPLIALDVKSNASRGLPQGTISLTETGRAVLRGMTDRVRECGLDRWLGGVHLEGSETMWR